MENILNLFLPKIISFFSAWGKHDIFHRRNNSDKYKDRENGGCFINEDYNAMYGGFSNTNIFFLSI